MQGSVVSDSFYDELPRIRDFDSLVEDRLYQDLPDTWRVGVSDIVDSTGHAAAGRYKSVNMVGAAVISAAMNANDSTAFPFVFGGDGASFAIPPEREEATRNALSAVSRWAQAEFQMELRTALVPVKAVRDAGYNVRVARFQASEGADYAMFSGGGISWAESAMKKGQFAIEKAPVGTTPDLTGLSCRWAHMPARQGVIVSLVVQPLATASPKEVAETFREIVAITGQLDRAGHPAAETGMVAKWPPAGATLEAHATRKDGALAPARRKALFEAFVAWVLIRTGLKVGGFDARRYARVVAANADFRKLDDGLKMTLDCDKQTLQRLTDALKSAEENGVIRFGFSTQDEAMMTCIVPSIMTDDHLHFIDGARGGYTEAAASIKAQLAS